MHSKRVHTDTNDTKKRSVGHGVVRDDYKHVLDGTGTGTRGYRGREAIADEARTPWPWFWC